MMLSLWIKIQLFGEKNRIQLIYLISYKSDKSESNIRLR